MLLLLMSCLQSGKVARLADAAVWARYGDSSVLATVVTEKENAALSGKDFMPLSVEFREKSAAGGEIPGTWNRREVIHVNIAV